MCHQNWSEHWSAVNWEKYTQHPVDTGLADFRHILGYSPISAGLCRRLQRHRARWGPWHWTRRCQRWSSWRRPPPPPPSPPPSLTHSLWASLKHPSFLPFLRSIVSLFTPPDFGLFIDNLVSFHDFVSFLPFCVSYCATLSTSFLVFCQSFSVSVCFSVFNWVVSGSGCVSWLRPSGGALHCSAAWSGPKIVREKTPTDLNQIQQQMLSRLWKMVDKCVSWF